MAAKGMARRGAIFLRDLFHGAIHKLLNDSAGPVNDDFNWRKIARIKYASDVNCRRNNMLAHVTAVRGREEKESRRVTSANRTAPHSDAPSLHVFALSSISICTSLPPHPRADATVHNFHVLRCAISRPHRGYTLYAISKRAVNANARLTFFLPCGLLWASTVQFPGRYVIN